MKRKAQIQMGENVIILFIFFILLVFAVVFFTRLQNTKTQQKISEDVEGKALEIAQRIAFLPEVQCTKDNAEVFSGCYDRYSLQGMSDLREEGKREYIDYYYDIFGFSTITVTTLFPKQEQIIIYDNQNSKLKSVITTNIPISVCDFLDSQSNGKECSFGVLKVEVYN